MLSLHDLQIPSKVSKPFYTSGFINITTKTLGKLLNLSVPQLPWLYSGNGKTLSYMTDLRIKLSNEYKSFNRAPHGKCLNVLANTPWKCDHITYIILQLLFCLKVCSRQFQVNICMLIYLINNWKISQDKDTKCTLPISYWKIPHFVLLSLAIINDAAKIFLLFSFTNQCIYFCRKVLSI